MLDQWAPWAGLIGLIGLAGLAGIKTPAAKDQPGALVRLMGLFGLVGFAGIWIPGAGALGAAGALGLWNHQNKRLAFWGRLGLLSVIGLPFLLKGLFPA